MENAKKRRKTLLFHLPADMAPVAAKIKTLCAGEVTDSETGEDFAFIRRFPGSRLFRTAPEFAESKINSDLRKVGLPSIAPNLLRKVLLRQGCGGHHPTLRTSGRRFGA